MAGSKSSMVVFMVMMVAAMQMQTSMAQTRHVVGDALGWTIPPNGAAAYSTWASGKTFTVGDTLFFNFTTGVHDVAEVSQAAYGPCTATNPISMVTTGPATVTLSTAGTHYYICTFGTHCSSLGQKVSVNVVSAATAPTTPPPAATPTTPPPAAAPTTPPPAATPTTPPPTATPTPAPVSPPTTTPTPAPAPTTTPSPSSSPAPSPNAASPPTPPTPTPGQSPSGSTPAPAADNTPTPPSPNSAVRSFTAVVPASLFVAAFALFF